ncbi:MAG: hypothetical protein MJZ39_02605 [Bacteroidales bacterium]|nr:hypothetical protein [Bacteroidales bacterium]
MKKTTKISAALLLFITILFAGCSKFEPATVEITSISNTGKNLECTATITDLGGCTHIIEEGFCYSIFEDVLIPEMYTTTIPVAYNLSAGDSLKFSLKETLPMADTVYYVRAYVKNNAGLSYSDIVKVNTSN